jgi:hypothetical protein
MNCWRLYGQRGRITMHFRVLNMKRYCDREIGRVKRYSAVRHGAISQALLCLINNNIFTWTVVVTGDFNRGGWRCALWVVWLCCFPSLTDDGGATLTGRWQRSVPKLKASCEPTDVWRICNCTFWCMTTSVKPLSHFVNHRASIQKGVRPRGDRISAFPMTKLLCTGCSLIR